MGVGWIASRHSARVGTGSEVGCRLLSRRTKTCHFLCSSSILNRNCQIYRGGRFRHSQPVEGSGSNLGGYQIAVSRLANVLAAPKFDVSKHAAIELRTKGTQPVRPSSNNRGDREPADMREATTKTGHWISSTLETGFVPVLAGTVWLGGLDIAGSDIHGLRFQAN